jgi:Mg-chelatase subunit ChlD
MKKGLTEIVCILDMSGSMASTRKDAVGGFNNFIEEQKKLPGDCNVTVVFFNSIEHRKWIDGKPLKDVPELGNEYQPAAMTPLNDSVGKTINEVGARLAATPEKDRAERVLVIIITDGMENVSKEFTKFDIKRMIEHQEKHYSWKFIFLGENVDAFTEAGAMGIQKAFACNYVGIRSAYHVSSNAAKSYRAGGPVDLTGKS